MKTKDYEFLHFFLVKNQDYINLTKLSQKSSVSIYKIRKLIAEGPESIKLCDLEKLNVVLGI